MKLVVVILVGLTFAGGAFAQGAARQKDPCETDARRYCKDAIPDDAKIAACLKTNQAKLSTACKSSYATRAKAKGM